MPTNPRDAFRDQSRSPNIVPFHMLGIVSSCAIVTLSLRRAVFPIFDLKKCRDLEIVVIGHSRSLKVVPFGRSCMVSYECSLVTLSLKRTVFEIFDL